MERVRSIVIDDSPSVRSRIAALLREAGITVVAEAGDGEEGLRMVSDHAPDVIVLDLHMPGVGGFAVLRELRARDARPRVVVLSNLAGLGYRRECERLGAEAFLDKSRDLDHIVAAVRGVLTAGS